jgi:tetratricopeptide (TPR) repeat protein
VEQDYAEGLRWYVKLADQGYVPAQYTIGYYYENGRGVEQNYAEALRWYRKAAEDDYGSAQNAIGQLYDMGKGVKQDDAEALRWYRKAAQKNNGRAGYHIGMFYAEGRGVPRDLGQAHAWMEEARASNDGDAFRWLARHPLDSSDGTSYLAAEEEHLNAARAYDDNLQSNDSMQGVAFALLELSWALTLNKQLPDAIARADEALKLFPSSPEVEVKRADALLLLGRFEDAKKIYLDQKDKTWRFGETFADVVRDDLAEMRRFGIDTADMRRVEELLAN